MAVKISDKNVYRLYEKTMLQWELDGIGNDSFEEISEWKNYLLVEDFLHFLAKTISTEIRLDQKEVAKVVNAILDGEKVRLAEQKYNLIIFKDSEAYHSVFYQFNNEINVIDDVKEYDLKRDAEYRFTQTEIDKYNKTNGLNVDLNAIKVPVEELND